MDIDKNYPLPTNFNAFEAIYFSISSDKSKAYYYDCNYNLLCVVNKKEE